MTDVQVGTILRGFVIASKKNTGIIVRLVNFFIYKLVVYTVSLSLNVSQTLVVILQTGS